VQHARGVQKHAHRRLGQAVQAVLHRGLQPGLRHRVHRFVRVQVAALQRVRCFLRVAGNQRSQYAVLKAETAARAR
jgi:hypothetical protein